MNFVRENKKPSQEDNDIIQVLAREPNINSNNKICNTKYTAFNFLPKVILLQFRSFSSIFFFIIMILQLFPDFAIGSLIASFIPWTFVLMISLINEGLDDYKRYKRDIECNSRMVKYWKNGKFEKKECSEIKTGDIVYINKGEHVPADCILLKTEDINGEMFIKTDQLDGETDWKRRHAVNETQKWGIKIIEGLEAYLEKPHKNIYSFNGQLVLSKKEKYTDNFNFFKKVDNEEETVSDLSMNSENEMIKEQLQDNEKLNSFEKTKEYDKIEQIKVGLVLENTIWANTIAATCSGIGLVIYTGNNTRSMMNTYKPRSKFGKFEKEIDLFIAVLGIVSSIAALIFTFKKASSFEYSCLVLFVRFIMIFSYVIPISLKVSLNLARIYYVGMLQKKLKGAIVRTSSLQEELGRISFFLTDKTGTLTKNEMIMKRLHLGTICYTPENNEEIKESIKKHMNETKSSEKDNLFRKTRKLEKKTYELMEALSVCHSVMPVMMNGKFNYQASSPDEFAIVKYSSETGMELIKRDRKRMVVKTVCGNISYRILETFLFNSDTKRMGIIVVKEKDGEVCNDSEIMFFMKGADSVMKPIINETDWAEDETDNMARNGFRTLLVAKKVLTQKEYEEFKLKYENAKLLIVNKNEEMLKLQKTLETGLELLGITGVEDMLQDRVNLTLEGLRNAGLKIWMLTGDKIETAISIALSSRLLNKMDKYLVISNCTKKQDIERYISSLKHKRYNSVIIDGKSLEIVIKEFLVEFIAVVKDLSCLVGCRYTPTQKAVMAAALKKLAGETVCCIGDGGNDVSMITEADVGIGIEGKEGNQASLAADFSIKNFAMVSDLLFWHGRRCYKNSSDVSGLIIHRGTVIAVIQGIFCALIHFFPISIFQGNMIPLFMCYTFFPLFALIRSEDVSRKTVLKFPELYKELRTSNFLSFKKLFICCLNSFFQASIIMLTFFWFHTELFFLSILVFTCMIFNEQLMILFTIERITVESLLFCGLSLFLYFISTFIFKELSGTESLVKKLPLILFSSFIAMLYKLVRKIYKWIIKPPSHIKLSNDKYKIYKK